MTTAVISAPHEHRALVFAMLGGLVHDVIHHATRLYVLSHVCDTGADEKFIDPIDGELLLECRFFTDETLARQWVAADIALRTAPVEVTQ